METRSNTFKIVLTAMMMCLTIVAILIIRIPIPFTQGYVHLGDAVVFLSVLVLGWKYGALAAAFGGMLSDIIGGFAAWAPWTFAIKGIMALILGLAITIASKKDEDMSTMKMMTAQVIGMIIAGAFMVAAYYVAEGVMYGNWVSPLLGIPWNIGQFAVGMVLAEVLAVALCKTPARSYFTYKFAAKS